ncbi:MAG: recombination mediator RecR [Candidatus Omnitrophica bacterium]|nr:recombination mediator RecR [Candidatus Omnitrophota bacterium]MDD5081628.1 recombination mediator RecR [Candidatus Omnitrophota bacterium]
MKFPDIFEQLINHLTKFPGIGRRSAERIAYHMLKMPQGELEKLAGEITTVQSKIKTCGICNNFATDDTCDICQAPSRDKDVVCIVEDPKDIMAIEKTGQYNGLYYVLMGAISPLDGVYPGDLYISPLINRIAKGSIKEIIISTNPNNEGELTAQYLIKKLSSYKIKMYRIAIGIPLGTQIEYIDSATLAKALQDRRVVV